MACIPDSSNFYGTLYTARTVRKLACLFGAEGWTSYEPDDWDHVEVRCSWAELVVEAEKAIPMNGPVVDAETNAERILAVLTRAGGILRRGLRGHGGGVAGVGMRPAHPGGARVALIEVCGCVFDAEQLTCSHGFESLDPIGREAFVNHIHLGGADRVAEAERVIRGRAEEMRAGWPDRTFRIYRHAEEDEITVRFHVVRPGSPNWCESKVEVIVVNG